MLVPSVLLAQVPFQQKGYVEYRGFGFPDTMYTDSGHAIGEALVRYDVTLDLTPRLALTGGTETRTDTHRQTERRFRLNWNDRGLQRPNFSIRRISLVYKRGPWTWEAGKQLIRWGSAGVLSPLDRFAPRDFLTMVDREVLAVQAVRSRYTSGSGSLEFVVQPFFTPTRIPLLNQRWTVLSESLRGIPVNDQGSRIPGGVQWGARWTRETPGHEISFSFFDGRNHQPLLETGMRASRIDFLRLYPRIRMYAADAVLPFRGFAVRGEVAYFTSPERQADEYLLYILQAEREAGKFSFRAGYSGEGVAERRAAFQFAPDRGFAGAFFGRSAYEIDAARTVTFETAVRQNGKGLWMRSEYSHAFNNQFSSTAGFTLLRGAPQDFLGQYRRNSFFNVAFRYSF